MRMINDVHGDHQHSNVDHAYAYAHHDDHYDDHDDHVYYVPVDCP